jgi:ribosome maturation factor RimP
MGATGDNQELEARVTALVADGLPEVEVVAVDVQGGRQPRLTVYVDRPGGVDLAVCEAVTSALEELRDHYALEVSSPGLDRPLRKPQHFVAALGARVYVKTATPLDGRSVYRGRLHAATTEHVTVILDEGPQITVGYGDIAKAHVIYEFDDNGGHRE